jgi:predicted nucleotidyltransferase
MLNRKRVKYLKNSLVWFSSRRKSNQESDIDIVIISEDFHEKDIFQRTMLTKEAEIMTIKKFMVPFDIITLTSEEFENENFLVAEYAKNGIHVNK